MAEMIHQRSLMSSFTSCLLAALALISGSFAQLEAVGAESGNLKARPAGTASLAQYIDTGSEQPRSPKPQPEVALASGVIAYEKNTRASLASQTVIAQHPGKQLVPSTYAARAPCWQSCFNGLWVRGEYLHWWTDAMDTPPLVTTSPAGTAPAVAGILGQPGTETLLGNGGLGGSGQSGARISFGWWLDPSTCRGIEANYFGLARRTSSFTANSASTPILARPVFDTGTNAEAAMLVAHPDFLTGSINVQAATEMQGAEALFRRRVYEGCDTRLDFLFGYRFARLDESLSISQSSEWTSGQGQIVVGTTKSLFDTFSTDNQFHGGEIGFTYARQLDCWSMDATMKLGLGNNHSVVVIDGQTVTTVPNGGSATFVGGLLAQQTNIGRFERDAFGFIPELAVTLRRDLGCNLQFSVGYNLMYWTATLRPGDQIDRQVSQFPPEAPMGTRQPEFDFQSRGFLVQGLQLGLEYKF